MITLTQISRRWLKIAALALIGTAVAYAAYTTLRTLNDPRSQTFVQWASGSPADRASLITVQREACPDAPFILPADGFIGLLYADPRGPYSNSHPHQGIDIFSDAEPGLTPVYAAYDGYITREANWKSSLIQRVPDDPLHPGQQIWLYYTHMADRAGNDFIEDAFAPGTHEFFVGQGTLLGYTGDYNGSSPRTVWTHLHFSVVRDDGNGRYTNELEFDNTLDPSPYLGMSLNYTCAPEADGCTAVPTCTTHE
ncbi:MAG: M23 family metallopeptidase [Ardenticatenaceae bacterium]|nr:M23 family metallopeptidase [Anaerolineales bacterium]MCB8922146.1 M23 family metallopeptidase [Ardenticatenaceae bacterium]MCB8991126.1 M23 family metallopeptidase [Ardenticatenaceae bacterium]MCB9005282.1 M23 family metallopeptidase [Ardenticatenaceae bacterium]